MIVHIRIPETADEWPALPVGWFHVSVRNAKREQIGGQNFQDTRLGWAAALHFIQSHVEEMKNPIDLPFDMDDLEVA